MEMIKYVPNKMKNSVYTKETALFSKEQVEKVYRFHKSMGDKYNKTPLARLDALAASLGLGGLYVKDESQRGNLKAFKLLGGAYAVANSICRKLGVSIDDVDFNYLKSDEVKRKLGDLTFAAASDGNHGKSVAWAAHEFNQKSIVYAQRHRAGPYRGDRALWRYGGGVGRQLRLVRARGKPPGGGKRLGSGFRHRQRRRSAGGHLGDAGLCHDGRGSH